MKKIAVADVSLSVLQEEKQSLTFREKLNIATLLDGSGVDFIELPVLLNEKENTVVYRTIANSLLNASVLVSVDNIDAVDSAYTSVCDAKQWGIQVVLPVSTVQMEYQYHLKSAKMLDKIKAICLKAKEKTNNVHFVARDASRAENGFLIEIAKMLKVIGVQSITICDDAGVYFPEDYKNAVSEIKNETDILVFVQPSDKLHMAAASCLEAIKAGADGIKCATNKDYLMLNAVSDVFKVKSFEMQAECNLDSTKIHKIVQDILSKKQAETEQNVQNINLTGLDENATINDIANAAKTLGYELTSEDNGKVFEEFKRVIAKKGVIGAPELEAIIATSAMQAPSTFHLVNYVVNNGNIITATASITLEKNGEKLSGVSTGDGPIDAAFHAIEQIVGHHYELDDFSVQAVTKGREAVGSSLIRLRANGKLYSGNGVSTDIVGACIRAYVNALNKIVYEEN